MSALVWMRSIRRSLSFKLFVWLFALITFAFAGYAYFSIRSTFGQLREMTEAGAQRFCDLIQHSTHYGMLKNRKEDVHQIIRTIAQEPGVEGVRIYDKQGVIIFSADDEEIGGRVDLRAEACFSCHESNRPLQSVPESGRMRIFRKASGDRVLGLINPIENGPDCYNAPCHAHPPDQSVLGVLDVTMSLAASDARLADTRRQAIAGAVLIALMAGLISALFIYRMVRAPVRRLIQGAQCVAEGDLSTELQIDGDNEISRLARAFNDMTRDLRKARSELTGWSNRLEERLEKKTEELGQTQRQIAHMDKMASLGKLAATVAHELNNPLAGILNYSKLIERTIRESRPGDPDTDELMRQLSLIQKEAGRSGTIVRNLLVFARKSGAEMALHTLNTVLERSVMLVRHHLEMAGIQLETEFIEGDDSLVCDADQLAQALVALMVNAVEAMDQGGTLRVSARERGDAIEIAVADTGVGIPEEALPHIFEPFYTSKENGEGTGLGLAVVYGIVQRHGGTIDVESKVEEGTRFRIILPRKPLRPESPTDEPGKGATAATETEGATA